MGAPAATRADAAWHAIVVGGGLAGMSAALRLAEAGRRVLLLETRKKLGGRATSFTDVRTGETLDNCQHVAMGCCVNYLDLCRRLGVADKLVWTREIHWVEAGGRVSTMRPGALPAPGHFTGSMLFARFLTLGEKLAVSRAMLAMLRTRPGAASRRAQDRESFGAWLRAHAQPAGAVEKFWSPIVVSACNIGVDRADAGLAIKVFRDGFLATRVSADIGVAAAPLVDLYDPAEAAIARAGGELRLGVSVERLNATSVTTADGGRIVGERVVCAVPPERAARMIDPALFGADPRFAPLASIDHSPILGVHMTFDRPVMRLPHATLVSRPTQWVFNKGSGPGDSGQRLHAVISAAEEWMELDEAEIGERALADIRACFPRAFDRGGLRGDGPARLLRVRAVKEKRATFAATPEVESARPRATGPSGVILAGDYTDTGWPATMEGAVRSGYIAAGAALERSPSWSLLPDLPPGVGVRLLAAL